MYSQRWTSRELGPSDRCGQFFGSHPRLAHRPGKCWFRYYCVSSDSQRALLCWKYIRTSLPIGQIHTSVTAENRTHVDINIFLSDVRNNILETWYKTVKHSIEVSVCGCAAQDAYGWGPLTHWDRVFDSPSGRCYMFVLCSVIEELRWATLQLK